MAAVSWKWQCPAVPAKSNHKAALLNIRVQFIHVLLLCKIFFLCASQLYNWCFMERVLKWIPRIIKKKTKPKQTTKKKNPQSFWEGWKKIKNGIFVHGESTRNFYFMINFWSCAGKSGKILETNRGNKLARLGKVRELFLWRLLFVKETEDICQLRKFLYLCSAPLKTNPLVTRKEKSELFYFQICCRRWKEIRNAFLLWQAIAQYWYNSENRRSPSETQLLQVFVCSKMSAF